MTAKSSPNPDAGGLRLETGLPSLDPTPRTTQQVLRENFWLRELLEAKLLGIEQRMAEGDKAVKLLQAFADRTPTTMDVQHQVSALREVVMEKFAGISDTFVQKEIALVAAFQAQEKQALATNDSNAAANKKTEDSFIKQIDGVNDKVSDIKDRLTIIESRTSISDPTTAITLAKLDATVQRLTSSTDMGVGRSTGVATMWALIVGGLGLVFSASTLAVLIVRLVN